MYIYMGKRKPKLCRVKRLDVSKIHIFLFTEDEPIYTLPFSFHFPFNSILFRNTFSEMKL